MNIQYRTRGNSTPNGKINIWLLQDGADPALTDRITGDILASQNCAIWYDTDKMSSADIPDVLSEMQLVVIAVTTNLLSRDSDTSKEILSYADTHNIPLLPILCESGLESLFNTRYNSMHALSREGEDATTRSYQEKLTEYLTAVLHTDEENARIRAAFSDSVFLSYRKKDRAHAQRLMKAIHADDALRDTAIWYDEYLIPGENFNHAITESLDRSDAFLLAVTPNLVCEENYVQAVEYPRAKANGKTIIPVEVVPTDREALAAQYADIPSVLTIEELDALRRAVLATRKADPDVKKTMERRYLLALAYLSGIDTEIDAAYAKDVLYDCASCGMPEAIRQLAVMYRYGIGVTKSPAIAINWYRRLTYLYDIIHREEGTEESLLARLSAYETLGDALTEQRSYNDANSAFYNAIENMESEESPYSAHLARIHEKIGLNHKFMQDMECAKNAYRRAFLLRAKMPRDYENLYALVTLCYRSGDLYISSGGSGDDAKAERYYMVANKQVKDLAQLENNEEVARLQCIIYEKLGDYYATVNDIASARELYLKYDDAATRLNVEFGTRAAMRLAALAKERLGNIARQDYECEEALEHYFASLNIREDIYREDDTFEAMRDLAVIHQKIGNTYLEMDDDESAEEQYDKSYEYSSTLFDRTQAEDAAFDSAVIMERMADLAVKREIDEDIVLEMYQQALKTFEAISKNLISPPLYISVAPAGTMDRIGHVYMNMNDVQHAEEYYNRALDLRLYLYTHHATKSLEDAIGESYSYLYHVAIRQLDFARARECEEYMSDPREGIRNESASVSARMDFDDVFDDDEDNEVKSGEEAYLNGDYEDALSYYMSATTHVYLPRATRQHVDERLEALALYFARKAEAEGTTSQKATEIWSSLAERAYTEDYLMIKEHVAKQV